jgi:hypothetical protein
LHIQYVLEGIFLCIQSVSGGVFLNIQGILVGIVLNIQSVSEGIFLYIQMFQEESVTLRNNVSYVTLHLYLKLNGYGDNDASNCGLLAVPRTVPV